MKEKILRGIVWATSYVLTAVIAVGVTMVAMAGSGMGGGSGKLEELEGLIEQVYIEQVDWEFAEDMAAWAMVESLPDGWSYYISAQEYDAYLSDMENSYVGVGITVVAREDGTGLDITLVEPGGSAQAAGVLPGDVLVQVDGTDVRSLDVQSVADMIRGDVGGQVRVTVERDGKAHSFTLTRHQIQRQVATYQMLPGNIGYIAIANFHERSAAESIAAVEALTEQGAVALIFDVRNNPGGYKDEMVELLDYLLPEGDLFRSVDYTGREEVDTSDASCVELPMAVLINGDSYSAAEFFAAALEEYDWAVTVGDPTVGKGHFQYTYELSDGSAVALSVGKYYTPKGISLADAGGLVPQVTVEVDEKTAAMIYSGLLKPQEDAQLQAAVEAVQK